MTPPAIETDRLHLRPFTLEDGDAFAAICGDPVVMRYYTSLWSREDAERFVERQIASLEQRSYSLLAVIHKQDDRFIGYCGLLHQQLQWGDEVEVGYMLDKAYWGRGLATEAARACMEDAFQRLGLRRLISLIHPENRASLRVAEKNGLRYERDTPFRGRPVQVYATEAG
jgi:[ribosomal protein S5]-alanine N-acetyltransferase